ncbi:MAG: N-acetylmuramoyl-L-alanine amidase, partial [Gemmatimonadota bacterium]
MNITRYILGIGALGWVAACNPGPGPSPVASRIGGPITPNMDSGRMVSSRLPPVPQVQGPLRIRVAYPPQGDPIETGDSSFIFGSVGNGDANLTINGQPVTVWPNGAWIGWVAFPRDSLMHFEIEARTATDSNRLSYDVPRTRRIVHPEGLWLDSLSMAPRGKIWWPANEYLPLSVRAAEGSTVRILLPGGLVIPLVTDPNYGDVAWGIRAFDRDSGKVVGALRADRYIGVLKPFPLGRDPGPVIGPSDTASAIIDSFPIIEAILGADTVRAAWPIRLRPLDSLPQLIQLDDDTARTGTSVGMTVGRALPGGTYHWFFPTGTRATVSGRMNGDLRLRLSSRSESWIGIGDAQPLPLGTPPLRATVGSSSLTPMADWVSFRIPLSQRIPFQITETEQSLELRLYSAQGDVNWIRYGGADPLVRRIAWAQPASDEVTVSFALAAPVWGYRTRWQQNDLILEIRRPPVIEAKRPLLGRRIVVDPGHPPLGATGPTGYREAEANLAVSLELRRLLEAAGAQVIMTRTTDAPVDLYPRVKLADSVNADLLISIHNNALPDGVNPFTNNGTSVFYNHPQSIPLAMAVERALVRQLGLRDLGVGRGDLALVRPTWMPAILCEGLFMMMPDQESALRQPAGQLLYARGVFEGIQ